jgi:hypothetical protein
MVRTMQCPFLDAMVVHANRLTLFRVRLKCSLNEWRFGANQKFIPGDIGVSRY